MQAAIVKDNLGRCKVIEAAQGVLQCNCVQYNRKVADGVVFHVASPNYCFVLVL